MPPALRLPLLALALCPAAASAQSEPSEARQQLARVEVEVHHYDNAVGSSDAASEGRVSAALLKSRPALRPGELLEFVPGVIVTQHSGDGKANQYFLRGFNLDHGTDFATTVAGLPVNMPTHGHGQGYSDLNFLMPELVDSIAYRKGPYFARNGDFSAAGSADIEYRRQLDRPLASTTLGQDGYRRLLGAASTRVAEGMTVLGALELQRNDGPWTVPEGLHKHNALLTLSGGAWQVTAMDYQGRWTSTDPIPERALQLPGFTRLDSLDASDGGGSRRSSLSARWQLGDADLRTELAAYLLRYRLRLFSNFSYALERPGTGDQFEQSDRRQVRGASARQRLQHGLAGLSLRSEWGLQLRQDRIDLGLYDTALRRRLATTREDRVRQTQLGLYAQTDIEWTPGLRSLLGLRTDRLQARVDSRDAPWNSGARQDSLLSPKLSLIASPSAHTELFFNSGRGFHSNDVRGSTASLDPKSGAALAAVPLLVQARGQEIGARFDGLPGLQSSLALWRLNFDSELRYVGDAGTTEASRASRRHGLEWNNRYVSGRLLIDADFAWTRARYADGDPAGQRIPNAVDRVASVALTLRELGPWSLCLQARYLGSAALTEDNRVRSRPTLLGNLRLTRSLGDAAELTLDVFNLTNRRAKDIEYFYASRLPGEAAAVEDRHFHPAEPRSARLTLSLRF